MKKPTQAALRAANSLDQSSTDFRKKVEASVIDEATGLPELIAALDDVRHAYIHEISPQAWLGVMRNVDAALRIASEGRS